MFFTRTMYLVALTLYTVLVAVLLVYFDANILWTLFFLSVIPMVVLWRLEKLKSWLIVVVVLFASVLTLLLETVGYINGIWYEIAPSQIRLFGLFPLESLIVAVVHILYFIILYEYFFDDRIQGKSKASSRSVAFLLFGLGIILALGLSYIYIFSGFIIPHAFSWLIIFMTVLFLFGVAHAKKITWSVFRKAGLFAASIFPLSLSYEYVSLSNNLRFFANPNEYLWHVELIDNIIPFEEIIFIFLVPFWIAVIYELYIDDSV